MIPGKRIPGWNLRANSSALRRRDPLAEEEGEGPGIPGALNKVASASNSTPQRRAETRTSEELLVGNCHAEFSAGEWNFARFLARQKGILKGAKPA